MLATDDKHLAHRIVWPEVGSSALLATIKGAFESLGLKEVQPMYVCESCQDEVDPADSEVIYAVELRDATTMGGGKEVLEGLGVFFHAGCYPYGATNHYRRKAKPTSILHRSPH